MNLGIRHEHNEAIHGLLSLISPISDTWTWGPFHLVHWQQLKTAEVMSTSSPRHTWTLYIRRSTLQFSVRYGLAPR